MVVKNLGFMVAVVFALIIIGQFVPCARAEVNEVTLVVNQIPSDPPRKHLFSWSALWYGRCCQYIRHT